jgi:uncharacterized membrane protein
MTTQADIAVVEQATTSAARSGLSARLAPLDALRGLIIVAMALDHANNFIARAHPPPELWSAPTISPPDALAFLTRFVTHFAAPGFFFLMGAGMALLAESRRDLGWSEWAIVRHLALRGGLLIILQLLVENPAWRIGDGPIFTLEVFFSYFGVLYGLGISMIVAAFLLRLRPAVLLGLGLAAELATELVITWVQQAGVAPSPLLQLLIVPGRAAGFIVYYPLLPWLGVALCGMAFGRLLARDSALAYRRFWQPPAAGCPRLDRLPQRRQVSAEHRLSSLDTRRRPATIGASGSRRPTTNDQRPTTDDTADTETRRHGDKQHFNLLVSRSPGLPVSLVSVWS